MRTELAIISATILVIFLGAVGGAHAWPAETGGAMPIAEAQKTADSGDYFTIEGVVVSSEESRLFTIRDRSGEMLVLIPDYITRKKGIPQRTERVRLTGKYDQKPLDTSVKGMRVSRMDLLGKMTGLSGSPSGQASPSSAVPAASKPAAPAPEHSFSDPDATVIKPTAPRELVDRMRAERIAHEQAKREVEAAAEAYADALHAAGDSGEVDPAITSRLEQAEARVAEIHRGIPALVREARAAGVAEESIELYKRSAGLSY